MVRFFKSLRFRLIILVVVALLPALGAIVYNGLEDRREATAAAENQLRHLVTMVAREQEQKTMAARQMLMALAQAPAVRRQDAEACSALFARLITKPSIFTNIGAVDRRGNIVASGVPMPGPLNASDWRYFKKVIETRDFAVGDLQYGRIVMKPVLIFGYPVLDEAGEVQTVLYASVRLDWLNHLAAQAQMPAGSVLTIIDDQGTIMAKYPDPGKWAGKSLPPGGLIDLIRKHGQGMAEARGMDGVPRLFAFMPLERDPQLGFVFAGIPTRVVYAAADQALRRNLAVLGGVLLLALGFAWGFGRLFFMRHINPLMRATARLAAGDLAARVGLTGGPEELGQLAQAFDHLAVSLEAREAERRRAEAALRESEATLRTLINANSEGLFLMDPEGVVLAANDTLASRVGKNVSELMGACIYDLIPPDLAARRKALIDQVIASGQPLRFDDQRGERFIDNRIHPIIDPDGRVRKVAVLGIDVTERKQAEASLAQRVHALAALYVASQAFLGQIGVDETLTQTCRLAVEQFGLRMAWVGFADPGRDYLVRPAAVYGYEEGYLEAIQVTWDDTPTGCGPGGASIRTRQAVAINDTENDPAFALWRAPALARGYRSVAGFPMFYGEEVVGTLLLYSGETGYFTPDRVPVLQAFANQAAVALQKVRLYEEIQRYAGELEQRVAERTVQLEATNQELDRFAYSVSHDLRAPLRAMQGFSQALLEDYAGELDPTAQDFARRINAASERMDHLIQDLLAYSRISREEMPLQPVSLEQTVAEAMAHLEGDIQARQALVRVEPPLPDVQAHCATLLQLVANLVSNAIKFTAPDVKPQVRLWAEDRGERVRLWVEDNGLGIAPEHQERIFRMFERLHGIEAYPGTGIGLAIVKKGVERMEGRVGVESELGQGSRFWVELEKAG